jgi:alpha-glucosidase (family GH31 glycosyl hydrolase)
MAGSRYTFPSKPTANPKAIVAGSHYRFTVLTDRLLRYEWSEDGGFEDRVSTFALFRWFDAPHYRVIDTNDGLEIITDYFHLKYNKKQFSSEGLSVTVGSDVWHYDGKSYGDLGGTARTLDGAYGRVDLEPGVLSRKSYAVLDDSKSMLFDDGWIATRRPGRIDGYVFAYNGDHKAAIRAFYRLSGNQPVLPRWTLGNWWSRYHEYTASEYLELMDHFKREGIPLNVGVVDMDWHKVNLPPGYGSGWTGYSWNRDLFPDPEGFLKELHKRNLKVTLNDHPADGIRAFEDLYPAVAKAMGRDPSKGEPVEFDCTDRKFLDVYFDVLKLALEQQGVDFWWIDWQQGNRTKIPGVDPLWVLNHYHYLTSKRSLKTLQRPLTFSRYAGAGSHRYPIGFSGDTQITWAGLEFQPEFTATASNIGYGWWSHDIGGHWGGVRSNQLTVRWVQLGCFSPIMRLHSTKNLWNSKEPWNFEKEAFKTIKDFLLLRHRLIPFLYTMNIRASYENEPLIQPMYWNHKDDEAYTVPTQYYFGPDLIVAPITSPDSTTTLMGGVRAWLPPGRFVDLFHPHLVYDGGRYMHLHRDLSQIPVLAKEGTILPLDSTAKLANGSPRPTEITILLVVGKDAQFELVEEPETDHAHWPGGDDDDEAATTSTSTARRPALSAYVRTPITWNQAEGLLTIGPEWNGSGKWRQWHVKLVGHTGTDVQSQVPGFRVTREDGCTTVSLGNVHRWSPEGFEIALGRDLQLDVVDIEGRVFDMLHRCEMLYDLKDPVWDIVRSGDDVQGRVERLQSLNVDAALKNAVMEIWAADGRSKGSAKGHEIWADAKGGAMEGLEQVLKEYVIV